MAAHRIPYVATATVGYPDDLARKVAKARDMKGMRFIVVLTPCLAGWGVPDNSAVRVSRLAVETGFFPLYEVEDGEHYTINHAPNGVPVERYLEIQRRYRHLTPEQVAEMQGSSITSGRCCTPARRWSASLILPLSARRRMAEPAPSRLLKNDASPPGRDGRARDKDARRARSSATCATEDAVSRRPVRSGGQGFDLQQPPKVAFIGGAGTVGSSAAFHLATLDIASEIVLIDARPNLAMSHVMDLEQAVAEISGSRFVGGDWADVAGATS